MVNKKALRDANSATANISVYAAVVRILEGGIYGGDSPAMTKIIAIAKKEMQRQLKHYDVAMKKLNVSTITSPPLETENPSSLKGEKQN